MSVGWSGKGTHAADGLHYWCRSFRVRGCCSCTKQVDAQLLYDALHTNDTLALWVRVAWKDELELVRLKKQTYRYILNDVIHSVERAI